MSKFGMHISHTERVTDKMNVEVIKELMKGEIEEKELPKVVERTLAYNRDGVLKELSMRDHRWVRVHSASTCLAQTQSG